MFLTRRSSGFKVPDTHRTNDQFMETVSTLAWMCERTNVSACVAVWQHTLTATDLSMMEEKTHDPETKTDGLFDLGLSICRDNTRLGASGSRQYQWDRFGRFRCCYTRGRHHGYTHGYESDAGTDHQ